MNTTTQATNSKQAFKITAKIDGKSWESKGTTLIANNEVEARTKAIEILYLKPEHTIEIEKITVHESSIQLSNNNYPYGRLKCTAFFSIEFTKNGFREVFQTINPKDGRINKPKKSTYYNLMLPCTDSKGHFNSCGHSDFNGTESLNRGLHFLNDFFELFTIEQIKHISLDIYQSMIINMKAQSIYCGTDIELLKPLYIDILKTLTQATKTGENVFLSCVLDKEKIEALKVPNYQPFKTVSY